jgi:hypothetical protein
MRRFSAYMAVGSMLVALVSAPFFHVHEADDHGHAGSVVHAHFLELEDPTPYSGQVLEPHHSHENVRWVDVFALSAPTTSGFHAVAEFSEPLSISPPVVSRVVLALQTLRAHSPPERSGLRPRSPPVL